jgi:hypothetical protein
MVSLEESKVIWISFLKSSDDLYLKPKANSVPAAPAPQIIIFGVIFFSNRVSSFY